MPLPTKLLEQGVRDMVRICDGRMSGTAYGTVVLHVAPEAAAGGPLGAGPDRRLDRPRRRRPPASTSTCPADELAGAHAERGHGRRLRRARAAAGSGSTSTTCMQADTGADLDFLRRLQRRSR